MKLVYKLIICILDVINVFLNYLIADIFVFNRFITDLILLVFKTLIE